jgi:tetratricopeptide (TPR) repeat protein
MALGNSGIKRSQKESKVSARLLMVAAACLFVVAIGLWFVVGSGGHFDAQDPQFASRRIKAEQGELWGHPGRMIPLPSPTRNCNARARGALEKLFSVNARVGLPALADLEDILIMDPDCVTAMRLAVQAAVHEGKLTKLHATFISRAERENLSVTAQIGAAIFSDHAGRSGDMLAFLTRAESLRPDAIGLATTWADYHRFHTAAVNANKVLEYWNRELSRSDDPRTLANMITFFAQLSDRTNALAMCDRFYKAVPQHSGAYPARTCLKQAAELEDEAQVAIYAARLETTGESTACQQRWVTYFRFIAGQPQARLQAAESNSSCPQLFPWLRGAALLAQGRQSVGVAVLSGAADAPAWVSAAVLALQGERKEAVKLLEKTGLPNGSRTALLSQLIEQQHIETPALLALFAPPFPATRGGHLAQAACGYLSNGFPIQAEQLLATAVSASPTDPFVIACQLRWFAAKDDLAGAETVAARAAELGIKHPYFTVELAHLRTQQGRCEEALPALESAQLKLPLEPAIYADLIRCLRKVGRTDEADDFAQLTEPTSDTWMWLVSIAVVVAVLGVTSVYLLRRRNKRR